MPWMKESDSYSPALKPTCVCRLFVEIIRILIAIRRKLYQNRQNADGGKAKTLKDKEKK